MKKTMKMLQMSDSSFPIGTFSFSNGLEAACRHGIVHNRATLKEYVQTALRQTAFTDGLAAILVWKAMSREDYLAIRAIDKRLYISKNNHESRLMSRRMGKKMLELGVLLFPSPILHQFKQDVDEDKTPCCHAVIQGMATSVAGLTLRQLFCMHQYGVMNMILGAALRCSRVSHIDTQQIMSELSDGLDEMFVQVMEMTLEDMYSFAPQMDVIASLHEKGDMRMFMN
jgi:urease accessory protein